MTTSEKISDLALSLRMLDVNLAVVDDYADEAKKLTLETKSLEDRLEVAEKALLQASNAFAAEDTLGASQAVREGMQALVDLRRKS